MNTTTTTTKITKTERRILVEIMDRGIGGLLGTGAIKASESLAKKGLVRIIERTRWTTGRFFSTQRSRGMNFVSITDKGRAAI